MSNNNIQLRVGVIGMGPVGSILAAHLISAGAFVVPCDINREKIDKIKKTGICLKQAIQKEVEVTEACYSAQELEAYNLNLIAISVKAPSLKTVLTQLSEIDSKGMFVMSAQNGIDNELDVARIFGEEKTLRMVINYAGSEINPNSVEVTFFNPPNYVAALKPQGKIIAESFAELLNSAQLDTKIADNIQDYVWEKAILNASLGPLCAITKRTMKDVMDSPDGFKLVENIIDESIHVAEAEGIKLGKNYRQYSIQYMKRGGHHRPTMLVDLENGLLTEIDHLNGKIVEYGKKHNIPTPINQSISTLIRMMERQIT